MERGSRNTQRGSLFANESPCLHSYLQTHRRKSRSPRHASGRTLRVSGDMRRTQTLAQESQSGTQPGIPHLLVPRGRIRASAERWGVGCYACDPSIRGSLGGQTEGYKAASNATRISRRRICAITSGKFLRESNQSHQNISSSGGSGSWRGFKETGARVRLDVRGEYE